MHAHIHAYTHVHAYDTCMHTWCMHYICTHIYKRYMCIHTCVHMENIHKSAVNINISYAYTIHPCTQVHVYDTYVYRWCMHYVCTHIHKSCKRYVYIHVFALGIPWMPPQHPFRHRAGICNLQHGMHAWEGSESTQECHLWNLHAPRRDLMTIHAVHVRPLTHCLACLLFSCCSNNSDCWVC